MKGEGERRRRIASCCSNPSMTPIESPPPTIDRANLKFEISPTTQYTPKTTLDWFELLLD
jgi:hypothetical protein